MCGGLSMGVRELGNGRGHARCARAELIESRRYRRILLVLEAAECVCDGPAEYVECVGLDSSPLELWHQAAELQA